MIGGGLRRGGRGCLRGRVILGGGRGRGGGGGRVEVDAGYFVGLVGTAGLLGHHRRSAFGLQSSVGLVGCRGGGSGGNVGRGALNGGVDAGGSVSVLGYGWADAGNGGARVDLNVVGVLIGMEGARRLVDGDPLRDELGREVRDGGLGGGLDDSSGCRTLVGSAIPGRAGR